MRIVEGIVWIGIFLTLAGNLTAKPYSAGPTVPAALASGVDLLEFRISPAQAREVGERIWHNECAGTVAGLTSWNSGEAFPSLGIGHFIWYPYQGAARFEESFPGLIAYFQERGVAVPPWFARSRFCPWKTRAKFRSEQNSLRMKELRHLLASTVDIQCDFIALRLARALPGMVKDLPEGPQRQLVRDRFLALFRTREGLFALMDYVNFKGEGTKESERYAGQGWGLLQVLLGMEGCPKGALAVRAFADSARRVLERRVENAPSDRRNDEIRWLPVWRDRLRGYLTFH